MFGYCHGSPKDNDGVHTLSLMLVQPSKFGNVVNHDIFVLTFSYKKFSSIIHLVEPERTGRVVFALTSCPQTPAQ